MASLIVVSEFSVRWHTRGSNPFLTSHGRVGCGDGTELGGMVGSGLGRGVVGTGEVEGGGVGPIPLQ